MYLFSYKKWFGLFCGRALLSALSGLQTSGVETKKLGFTANDNQLNLNLQPRQAAEKVRLQNPHACITSFWQRQWGSSVCRPHHRAEDVSACIHPHSDSVLHSDSWWSAQTWSYFTTLKTSTHSFCDSLKVHKT